MKCGLALDSDLTGRNRRAHFTICPKRPAASDDVERRRGTLKVKRGRPAGPRMKCGWGCGEQLTGRNMRVHFTICAMRPAASDDLDRRGGSLKVKRGLPSGRAAPPRAKSPALILRVLRRLILGHARAREIGLRGTNLTFEGCVWGCGQFTGRNMRAHFTVCAKRPAASDRWTAGGRNSKAKRRRILGKRMLCGWGCGTRSTVTGGWYCQESRWG